MSQDEIVFEEVRYREPERICRPDRDRRYACLAYELPGPEDLPIFLERCPADAIERHALRDTSVELGGSSWARSASTRRPASRSSW